MTIAKVFSILALLAVAHGIPIRPVASADLTLFLNSLVALDQRTDSDVVLDYQNMASHTHFDHDNAPNPLFTSVAPTVSQTTTFKALTDLLTYYQTPDVNTAEIMTPAWNQSLTSFMTAVMATPIMQQTQQFLSTNGYAPTDPAIFQIFVTNLWFTLYSRNTVVGSSGFESLFAGEVEGTNVIRFNNWYRFQQLEQQGVLNYHGWFSKENAVVIDTQFQWATWQAIEQAFFLNTSPEFELAVYTTCALAGNGQCSVAINGGTVNVIAKTLSYNGIVLMDQCSVSIGSNAAATTKKPSGGSTDPQLQTLVDQMRAQDVDKPAADGYKLDWGNKETGGKDVSTNKLFVSVNEAVFQRPVYSVLLDVYEQNLFQPDTCKDDSSMTGNRKASLLKVIDTWTNTQVFNLAFNYLKTKGVKQAADMTTMKNFLFELWFGTYSRCSSNKKIMGSSGWEHVFSGEWKQGTVDGQHNWARYYLLEKDNKINYYGYYSYDGQLTGTFEYMWETELKKEGGFLFGTSPVFDFSLFTVCSLVHSGANACKFTLDGYSLAVTSYTQACAAGTCLSTSYPTN